MEKVVRTAEEEAKFQEYLRSRKPDDDFMSADELAAEEDGGDFDDGYGDR